MYLPPITMKNSIVNLVMVLSIISNSHQTFISRLFLSKDHKKVIDKILQESCKSRQQDGSYCPTQKYITRSEMSSGAYDFTIRGAEMVKSHILKEYCCTEGPCLDPCKLSLVFKGFPGNKPLIQMVLNKVKTHNTWEENDRNRLEKCFHEVENSENVTGSECLFEKSMESIFFKFMDSVFPELEPDEHRSATENYTQIMESGAAADFPTNFHLLFRLNSCVFKNMRTPTYGRIVDNNGYFDEIQHWRLIVGVHRKSFSELFLKSNPTITTLQNDNS